MKSKQKFNPFLCSFAVFSIFVLMMASITIGLFYYIFSIPEPEGLSIASWAQMFTDNFSVWMDYEDENLEVEKIGLDRLDEYGLWIQVIDESGQEIFLITSRKVIPQAIPLLRCLLLVQVLMRMKILFL